MSAPQPARVKSEPRRATDRGSASIEKATQIAKELSHRISGEVRFDAASKALYATDASNYRQVPIGVVIPKTQEDVIETIAVCREFDAPVLSRAGGTSLAGQCCNTAVVIDWSKYLNKIRELNAGQRYARVEPGVIYDDVIKAARPHDLTFGPQPATHDHCCFGGMLGNNSCGAHAQMNGPAVNNVEWFDGVIRGREWRLSAKAGPGTSAPFSGRSGHLVRGASHIG